MKQKHCFYCPQEATTKDHVIPLSKGGKNNPENKVPCCPLCNSTKGNLPQEHFIRFMDFVRQQGLELHVISKKARRVLKHRFLLDTGINIGANGGMCGN